jgi:hypothetical protein
MMRDLFTRLRGGRGRGRAATGQAVVEVAAAFALLVPLVVGAVDLGRAYFAYDALVHAVNEGVRVGTFDADATHVVAAVLNAAPTLGLGSGDVAVTCYGGSGTTSKSCASMVTGDSVKIDATTLFTPITPIIGALLPGGTVTLGATARRTFQ